ncbi:hypothetical protein IMG5_164510 [Ichthyophthirius multifiliis]|uniref:Ion transport domain-containing protein n=1 Tax=Ichthyophthirius multifiliis TaxID=5932 RepID=G0R0G0_ICHMU|nr:hypothetical protein IMG5_164510 [Ichthyophthirius multifiliis]EGR29039.1 hypothetical protein IMG5_164510 [Ichthyophthirius multifiliis]|eukprot:XP_004030275.1 hypothetical protein IMG5_164510 [Ichthyophthirius multifiliis]
MLPLESMQTIEDLQEFDLYKGYQFEEKEKQKSQVEKVSRILEECFKIQQYEGTNFSEGKLVNNFSYYLEKIQILFKETLSPEGAKESYIKSFILISLDIDNIYNAVYFIITILAVNKSEDPLVYAFLLLDIVKRSLDLQNVIAAITTNARNLLKFACLGLIILYIYAIIGYNNFKDFFNKEAGAFSDTFFLTITSVIKEGLRNGGGIADSLNNIDYNDENSYSNIWKRYAYDLSFFGYNRQHIDTFNKNGWNYHIYQEHNLYNINECAGIEKYVKDKINDYQTDFFPIQRSLQEEKQKEQK